MSSRLGSRSGLSGGSRLSSRLSSRSGLGGRSRLSRRLSSRSRLSGGSRLSSRLGSRSGLSGGSRLSSRLGSRSRLSGGSRLSGRLGCRSRLCGRGRLSSRLSSRSRLSGGSRLSSRLSSRSGLGGGSRLSSRLSSRSRLSGRSRLSSRGRLSSRLSGRSRLGSGLSGRLCCRGRCRRFIVRTRLAHFVVVTVIDPPAEVQLGQNVLTVGLCPLNRGEITDTDAVERTFQFTRIFHFHHVGFNILIGKLLDDSIGSLLGGLDADLNHVLTVFFGLDATRGELHLFGLGSLALLCGEGLNGHQFGFVRCRGLGFGGLGGPLDGHLRNDIFFAAIACSQHEAGKSCGNQGGNRK